METLVFKISDVFSSCEDYMYDTSGKVLLGDFEIEYFVGNGVYFDLGVNYFRYGNLIFGKEHGNEEFSPYIWMLNIAFSDALG